MFVGTMFVGTRGLSLLALMLHSCDGAHKREDGTINKCGFQHPSATPRTARTLVHATMQQDCIGDCNSLAKLDAVYSCTDARKSKVKLAPRSHDDTCAVHVASEMDEPDNTLCDYDARD